MSQTPSPQPQALINKLNRDLEQDPDAKKAVDSLADKLLAPRWIRHDEPRVDPTQPR